MAALAFWLVGLAIGLNFGGVPTAERPVLLSLVPDIEAAAQRPQLKLTPPPADADEIRALYRAAW